MLMGSEYIYVYIYRCLVDVVVVVAFSYLFILFPSCKYNKQARCTLPGMSNPTIPN